MGGKQLDLALKKVIFNESDSFPIVLVLKLGGRVHSTCLYLISNYELRAAECCF